MPVLLVSDPLAQLRLGSNPKPHRSGWRDLNPRPLVPWLSASCSKVFAGPGSPGVSRDANIKGKRSIGGTNGFSSVCRVVAMQGARFDFTIQGLEKRLIDLAAQGYEFGSDFSQTESSGVVYLRHDVDLSLRFARDVSLSESLLNSSATFFLQSGP